MYLPIVLVIAAAFFVLQLVLCFQKGRRNRFLLLTVAAGVDGVYWILLIVSKLLRVEDSLGFPAAILGIVGLYWIAAAALAWAVYGIVRVIKKS